MYRPSFPDAPTTQTRIAGVASLIGARRRKTSATASASPGTAAALVMNTTAAPEADIAPPAESRVSCAPEAARLMRVVVAPSRSRRNTSVRPAVSPLT